MSQEVVLTGLGPVSAAGIGSETFLEGLASGADLVAPISIFDASDLPCSRAAQVRGLNLADHLESAKTYLDRCSEFALAAASLALKDAAFSITDGNAHSAGLCLGSTYGCLGTMQTFFDRILARGAKFANALMFSHSYVNTPISLVAIEFGLQGFHCTYSSGVTSGLTALVHAADVLRNRRADAILAGGVDALCGTLVRALCDTDTLRADDGETGCVPGEGAGLALLEREDHASARGAAAKARLLGAGLANDLDLTGKGLARSMISALDEAGVAPSHCGAVSLASNGDPRIDTAETEALGQVFGDAVPEQLRLKQQLGEAFAAGGPLAVIAATRSGAGTTLINSMDAGGACASLVIRSDEGGAAAA